MASSRTINAPGIELREIDRSRYGQQDYSLPNAPTVLVTGFAPKGDNYFPQWINQKETFFQKYGQPVTEEEKYFYNACVDVIDRGGVCIACKLPYNNVESKDGGRYTYCDYEIGGIQPIGSRGEDVQYAYDELKSLDDNLTSFVQISSLEYGEGKKGTISISELDDLRTGMKSTIPNKIRIVDISKMRYETADFPCVSSIQGSGEVEKTNDALGIFPVIVSPTNAIFFQGLFESLSSNLTSQVQVSCYNAISQLSTVASSQDDWIISINLSALPANQIIPCACNEDSTTTQESQTSSGESASYLRSQESLSKIAADQFPLIGFKDSSHLDSRWLKHIGVVVFRAYTDASNSNKVNFEILESFVGSLDKTAKSPVDNSSEFIDNIVNSTSRYINIFSNASQSMLKKTPLLHICNQKAKMLGFYQKDCIKSIYVKNPASDSYGQNDILDSLSRVLELCKDPNQIPLDLVVDAGVSNITQFYDTFSNDPDAQFPVGLVTDSETTSKLWQITKSRGAIEEQTKKWKQVLKKFDDFCHFTRKDCLFLGDGLRPFCLEGDQKKVRRTKLGSTVEKEIVPYINHIAGINSSYSAGYCDWFQVADQFSGDFFWCPPSIKAASICIYCDTYFHPWDAPAGMIRGIVPGAVDVSFNPNKDDAGKIYQQGWNYAISYPLDGIVMEGQKTFQQQSSALDRLNVRRLLLRLEKQVTRAAKYFLYEQNTDYQRQKFVDSIRPFFEDAKNGDGISDYAIKCDAELNTETVIENNEMRCKIAVKPVKTIEYIVISLIATSQSASVAEEVLK